MIDYSEYGLQSTSLLPIDSECVPYFLPDDMEMLGIFSEIPEDNMYGVASTQESKAWFIEYKATGHSGTDYYDKLKSLYQEMVLHPTNVNKQRVLEFGWNPEIDLNTNTIAKVFNINSAKLTEAYGVTVIDLTNKDIVDEEFVDTDEDYLKYYSSVVLETLDGKLKFPSNAYMKNCFITVNKYFTDQGLVFLKYKTETEEQKNFLIAFIQEINTKLAGVTPFFKVKEITMDNIDLNNELIMIHCIETGDAARDVDNFD